jgi:very-short-patch-repair endonuclease
MTFFHTPMIHNQFMRNNHTRNGPLLQQKLEEEHAKCLERCRNALKHSSRDFVFSHLAALRLLDIEPPLFPSKTSLSDTVLQVSVARRSERSKIIGIDFHVWNTLSSKDIAVPDAGDVCVKETTLWLQMARYVSFDELVVLGDSTMRTNPQITTDDFRTALDAAQAFHGKKLCRQALPLISNRSDSSQETRLRMMLHHARLPLPRVNYEIPSEEWGNYPMRVDLAYPNEQVAIEYDGDHHRTDLIQWQRDREKRRILREMGWTVFEPTKWNLESENKRAQFCATIQKSLLHAQNSQTTHP